MKITTKTDYAVVLLISLTNQPKQAVSLDRVARDNNVSEAYLQRIAARLKKAGLIKPKLGAFGGYLLAKKPETVTLFDVVAAVGDNLYTTRCTNPGDSCPNKDNCKHTLGWNRFQKEVTELFAHTTLKAMSDEPRK